MNVTSEGRCFAVRDGVAATARMIHAAGLVEAFGHVSARTVDGFAITSTSPLADASPDDVLLVDADAPLASQPGLPLETAMHALIYRRRDDVDAICRGHPPYAVVFGAGDSTQLPMRHGLGALAGMKVPVYLDCNLVTDFVSAEAVTTSLGDGYALVLRANGALAVGGDLVEAATRLYFLEERARVALQCGQPTLISDETWRVRGGHSSAEMARAKCWFVDAFGGPRGRVARLGTEAP